MSDAPVPPSADQPRERGAPVHRAERTGPRLTRRVWGFLRRLYKKAAEDNAFFLAGAVSFNVLAAVVPLLLFAVGVAGIILAARFGDPSAVLIQLLLENLPVVAGDNDFVALLESQIRLVIGERRSFTLVGAFFLVWFSTRLVGSIRVALQEVFDVAQQRGLVAGKLFDAQVVLMGGVLFSLNIGITAAVEAARDLGVNVLGLEGEAVTLVQDVLTKSIAFASIWVLFLVVYRYLPARLIAWRTALIAATFAALAHEGLKYGFGWYATEVANYGSAYGTLITMALLFFWIYYEALVFILGGEFAQVWTMRRALRVRSPFHSEGSAHGERTGVAEEIAPDR